MSETNAQFEFTDSEAFQRKEVLTRILDFIERGERILLPDWDGSPQPLSNYALLNVGREENEFGGKVGPWRYQFEGEDDLLHLMICRLDQAPLPADESRALVSWLLKGVPVGLYWVRHATHSHHFYVGHDILPGSLEV